MAALGVQGWHTLRIPEIEKLHTQRKKKQVLQFECTNRDRKGFECPGWNSKDLEGNE